MEKREQILQELFELLKEKPYTVRGISEKLGINKQTAYATPVQRLLFATGDVNLHASLVRPAERLAVVAAALVKKFLMQAVNISDGSTASWQLMPRILTWYGEALELNPNLLAFRG